MREPRCYPHPSTARIMDFRSQQPQYSSSFSRAPESGNTRRPGFFSKKVRIRKIQLAVYSRQMATLLKAGVPIVQALKVMLKQEQQAALSRLISAQIIDVEGGRSFSHSLRAYPEVFDTMYVSLVVAGEKAGVLHLVMARLAHYLERSLQTTGKVRSAMIYPLVVLCASVLIVTGLLIFVIPQFEDIFHSMLQGAALPMLTRWVLDASRWVKSSWLWGGVGLLLTFSVLRVVSRIPSVQFFFDRFKLRTPVFGRLMQKALLARFCRTFGTLLESAVPMLDAIDTASDTLSNKVLESVFQRAKLRVRDGISVAESFETEMTIPPVVVGMVEVGETTGDLPAMLLQVAETYEQEVEVGVDGLTTLIEPIMILVLAVVIGFLVIALFLPIVEIMQHLGG